MAEVPYGHKTQKPSPVSDVHIVWMTSGLGCDGDSVSITAATQPSIEDVSAGRDSRLPKVHLHNPVLAYEVGDEFLKYWYHGGGREAGSVRAGRGGLDPQREDQEAKATGPRSAPIRRPASRSPRMSGSIVWLPKLWRSSPCGTCATYGGIHAM